MLGLSVGLGIGTGSVVSGGGGAAVTLNPATGVNKYSGITLTNGNLGMGADGVAFTYEFVRATRGASAGDVQFEVTIGNNNNFMISVEDGTQDFSVGSATKSAVEPGSTGHPTTGYTFDYVSGNGFINFVFNGSVQQFPSATINNADKLTIQINKTTGTIKVLLNGTQLGTTITGMTWTNWYAALGTDSGTSPTLTANFAGPFSFGANAAY